MAELPPAVLLATRYARDLDRAAVVIVAGWHVLGAGPQLWSHVADYAHPLLQVAAWVQLAAVIVSGAAWPFARRKPAPYFWTLAAVALADHLLVCLTIPHDRLLETDWAWGTTGWTCVLLLLRRPIAELIAFLLADAAIVFSIMITASLDRQGAAAFITVLYASASIQLAVTITARALEGTAQRAVRTATAQAATATRQLIAEQVHAARRARYLTIGLHTGALLAALANGTADPGDPVVRTDCAIAAARLRRLFAESDDVPDPLLHELRACADIAERRLIRVDIETIGRPPDMPAPARRAITEAAIDMLTSTRSHARITVSAGHDGVAVAIVADVPQGHPPPATAANEVAISHQHNEEDLWMEARWSRR
jgi:hypothetical protein